MDLTNLARTPRLRTIEQFAEEEVRLPSGPDQGLRFRASRHPAGRIWLRELDSGRWRRAHLVACNQDGKSLMAFVLLAMWVLFELKETLILAIPSLDLVKSKWTANLLPAIQASQYKSLLPSDGAGSRDGETVLLRFKNRAMLRWMTAGGSDQSRAEFTTGNLLVSELEGFDKVGGSSREGDKFSQLLRRTKAFGEPRVLTEGTAGSEAGKTWTQYLSGTQSRLCLPCPHCGDYVTPEREHFRGWEDAESETAAAAAARVHCPACGAAWTDAERADANRQAVLAHKGQAVAPDGAVSGPVPETRTFSLRWSCVNAAVNQRRMAEVAAEEWAARRAADEDTAETELRQSQWAMPAKPAKADVSALDAFAIVGRQLKVGRGACPPGSQAVTVACDVGKWRCHWSAFAWRGGTPHVVEYGVLEVPSDRYAVEQALLNTLRDWRDAVVSQGWPCDGGRLKPAVRLVDCGGSADAAAWQETVLQFAAESGEGWMATKGYGFGQRTTGRRRDTGSEVVGVGEHYALVRLPSGRLYLEFDADRWKDALHDRLRTPLEQAGALTLYQTGQPLDHLSFAKHLTAERRVERFDPEKGTVQVWEAVRRANHWLDAAVLNCVAGHVAGMRLVAPAAPPAAQADPPPAGKDEAGYSPQNYRGKW